VPSCPRRPWAKSCAANCATSERIACCTSGLRAAFFLEEAYNVTVHSPIAILSALAEEQQGLIDQLQGARCVQHAGRDFWLGQLQGQPVVLALSRIGKVAAATTAAALIAHFQVRAIVFTGVAGGIGEGVEVGDVVVATAFVQHDMDASPLFPRFEVPLTGRTQWPADADWTARLYRACLEGLADLPHGERRPVVHQGLVATGDRFVSSAQEVHALRAALLAQGHTALAVEMEGAAVAQVCSDYGIACTTVRTVSDRADDTAHVDFPAFVRDVASVYANRIVHAMLRLL
jgi:adenosylhomocysteine nucleosidase